METVLEVFLNIIIFLIGASIFSFLNVVIYRVPRKLSFVSGRSMCPQCGKNLKAIDMIPILNWIFLKGRCRFCKGKISIRYPLVELLGGIAAIAAAYIYGYTLQTVLIFAFFGILTVTAFVDYDTMEIPNEFVVAALIIGVFAFFAFSDMSFLSRLAGGVCVSLPMLLITFLIPGAFGGGDIKLMAVCGLFLGWQLTLLSFFLAVLGGGAYGGWLLITKKKGRKEHFAFGPFLCAGMAAAVFIGTPIINWYAGFLY